MAHFYPYTAERSFVTTDQTMNRMFYPSSSSSTHMPTAATASHFNTSDLYSIQSSWMPESFYTPEHIAPFDQSTPMASLPNTEYPLSAFSSPASSVTISSSLHTDISHRRNRSNSSRSSSPNPNDLYNFGYRTPEGAWRCNYPKCSSKAVFTRGCDLRKHYNRHSKTLFCRDKSCPQSREGGFSSKKDRLRHEQKHNPSIRCEVEDCGRLFSRVDNMKDHVRRIHKKPIS